MSERNLHVFHNHCAKLRVLAASILLSYQMMAAPIDRLIRKDVGSFKLSGRTTPSKTIKQVADGRARVLLFLRHALPASACQALSIKMKRVQSFGMAFSAVSLSSPIRGECFGDTKLEAPSELISLLKLSEPVVSGGIVLVVDADGVIRYADVFGSVPVSTWSQQDREILLRFIRGF